MTVLKLEEIAPVLPEYADRVRCFDLRVACAGAKPLSAILAIVLLGTILDRTTAAASKRIGRTQE